ncbi:MAG TPA: PKD domain-containing protein, partial [Candidatus Bathyarchaeia archaeon]|nr:PKD domain-containing protein [Candidatus Bathyarchaeia archaeon]
MSLVVAGSRSPFIAKGQPATLPNVGVWNDACFAANITAANPQCALGGASLAVNSRVIVDINVTNAPLFNGYEFSLFYDPTVLKLFTINFQSGTMFNQPLVATNDNLTAGIIRESVVNLGSASSNGTVSGSGVLISFTFTIAKVAVSPIVLAAGTAHPAEGLGAQENDWTRLAHGNNFINVSTSDGYFQNNLAARGPVASFTMSPSLPQRGQPITFDASSSFDPDNKTGSGIRFYNWDFGDGFGIPFDITPKIAHTYGSASGGGVYGNFSARLTVVDFDNGFEGMVAKLVTVTPLATAPNAVISSPLPGTRETVGQMILFDGSASTSSSGVIASYAWSFGDGSTGSGSRVYHGYSAAGNYLAALTVSDNAGLTGNATVLVMVASPDTPPVARFTFSPLNPVPGTSVFFDGTFSFDPDGTIQSWTWNFGSTLAFGSQVFHMFSSPGNYSVTLTVTDNGGLMNSITQTINVRAPLTHDVGINSIFVNPNVAVSGQTINIDIRLTNLGSTSEIVNLTAYYDN